MKNGKTLAPRNKYVVAAKFRKAGVHVKSEKAIRRGQRIKTKREADIVAVYRTFNPAEESSNLSPLTSSFNK